MPTNRREVGDLAGHKGIIPIGVANMKNRLTSELVEAIENLTEEKQQQVVEFVSTLVGDTKKRPLREILREYTGTFSFKTAEEVDSYLRGERDSWDR